MKESESKKGYLKMVLLNSISRKVGVNNNNIYSFLILWHMPQHGTCIKQGLKI